MRRFASVCGATAGCRAISAKTDAAVEGLKEDRIGIAGGAIEYGHFSLTLPMDGPGEEAVSTMAQWCLPFLRQHWGRLASAALVPKRGSAKGIPKSISSEMARRRRTESLWQTG